MASAMTDYRDYCAAQKVPHTTQYQPPPALGQQHWCDGIQKSQTPRARGACGGVQASPPGFPHVRANVRAAADVSLAARPMNSKTMMMTATFIVASESGVQTRLGR